MCGSVRSTRKCGPALSARRRSAVFEFGGWFCKTKKGVHFCVALVCHCGLQDLLPAWKPVFQTALVVVTNNMFLVGARGAAHCTVSLFGSGHPGVHVLPFTVHFRALLVALCSAQRTVHCTVHRKCSSCPAPHCRIIFQIFFLHKSLHTCPSAPGHHACIVAVLNSAANNFKANG